MMESIPNLNEARLKNVGLYCINRYSKYDGLSMKTAAESP